MIVWPRGFVSNEWHHEVDSTMDAAMVRRFEGPKIVGRCGEDLAAGRDGIEIEERIAVGFGASQLLGEASVGRDLVGDDDGAKSVAAVGGDLGIAGQASELRGLHKPGGGVIVFGVTLLFAAL